jgi:hypothetical protein
MYPNRRSAPEAIANIRNGKKSVAPEALNNSIKPCAPPGNESVMKPNGSLTRESAMITHPVTQAWLNVSTAVSDTLSESSLSRGNVPIKQTGTSAVTYKSSIVNRGLINQRTKRKKIVMRLDKKTTMTLRPSLGNIGRAAKTTNAVKTYTHTRAAAITMANDNRLEEKSKSPTHISVKRGLRVLKKI